MPIIICHSIYSEYSARRLGLLCLYHELQPEDMSRYKKAYAKLIIEVYKAGSAHITIFMSLKQDYIKMNLASY